MTDRPNRELLDLPVLPLRDVVVFPHMVIPLFVGRDKSIRALDLAMEADKRILLVAQKSAETDDPGADDLYEIGTLAQVLQLLKLPDGTIKVLVEGVSRARVADVGERDGALCGQRRRHRIDATSASEREVEAVARSLMSLFEQYVKTNRKLPPELLQTLAGIDEPEPPRRHHRRAPGRAPRRQAAPARDHRRSATAWNCWSASSTARSTCSRWKSASAAASSRRWRRASASTTSTSR